MSAMTLQYVRVATASYADYKSKLSSRSCLYSGNRILDHNSPSRLSSQKPGRQQESVRCRFSLESLRVDCIAIDPHLEELFQLDGLQDRRALLTRSDHRKFIPIAMEQMDELHASIVSLHAFCRDGIIDQLILAIPKSAHRFDVYRVFSVSLGEFDAP